MLESDWFFKGIILTCLLILSHFYLEARRYDKCTTIDGGEGVCVVKKYCREATNHPLLPCERDEENHCCPIPTTQRSAQPASWPTPERPKDSEQQSSPTRNRHDERDRSRQIEGSKEPNRSVVEDRPSLQQDNRDKRRQEDTRIYNTDRNHDQDYDIPKERDRVRLEVTRDQPRVSQDERDRRRQDVPRDEDEPRDALGDRDRRRPDQPTDESRHRPDEDRKRSDVSRDGDRSTYGYDRQRPEESRERDRPRAGQDRQGTEMPRDVDRPKAGQDRRRPEDRGGPGRVRFPNKPQTDAYDRDRSRQTEYKDLPRDDRLNKTPPPSDRRSPTRHLVERPPERDEDVHENNRRRPTIDRDRNDDNSRRPSSPRPVEQDRRKSPAIHFYPSMDELDIRKDTDSRTNPGRNRNDNSSKNPIRFPDTYELSVPRPKVPACGVKPYELFIAGGVESEKNEWPWMTAIFRRHSDSRPKTFLCGGSLINTKYVLTAAHCFVNNYVVLPASSFVVRLGSHQLDSGEEYTVSNLVIHHNHSGSDFFNDIALVRLASEVYVTDKIAPVCLPYPEMMQHNLVGRMATVAGWGDVSFRSNGDRILQHVAVPIVSGEECFAAYSRVRGAAFLARGSDHVICAGLREGGKDACLGDSGGPLMLKMTDDRWIVVGIVSLGYKCAEPGYPGVYTRVTHYMSWINTNMKKH